MNSNIDIFHERKRREEPRSKDWRSSFSRDKARIIHSAGFRRLQGKTQVMGIGEGDFHRTRLTHSLEVNQIGVGLFKGIKKREDIECPKLLEPFLKNGDPVIAAACYGHDLGHPPFGHGGERALHSEMRDYGGFEGNAQTIRLITKLEKYYENEGINPTRRVLLSLLKYPVNFNKYPNSDLEMSKRQFF
jgi:dGTPase